MKMKELKFGIEIETVGASRETLARAIATALGGTVGTDPYNPSAVDAQGRKWTVVYDGSLAGNLSGEVVSPILGYDDLDALQAVVRALRAAGARADASAGIHIHASHPDFDAPAAARLLKLVAKQEAILEQALGIQTRRRAQYCKPVDDAVLTRIDKAKPKTMQELADAWYGVKDVRPERYHRSRYAGINLNALLFRGALEVRWFESTLHAGEVKAYVHFVLALVALAMTLKSASGDRRTYNAGSGKYDFRVFMIRLGLKGPEFKHTRMHLMKRLGGSAAWKNGRPAPSAPAAPDSAPTAAPEAGPGLTPAEGTATAG